MPFEIKRHPGAAAIVEVVYPERPSKGDVDEYVARIRTIIEREARGFACLVDQRRLAVMPPELVPTVTALNAYAQSKGMLRSARVVTSAVAGLQSARMAREASLRVPMRTFESRDEALTWLTEAFPTAKS
jgi:hypothetical protein